jgi:hypothetical protein
MASSAAAQIEATAGESLKLEGTTIPDYVSLSRARSIGTGVDEKGDDSSDFDRSSHCLDATHDSPWTRERWKSFRTG